MKKIVVLGLLILAFAATSYAQDVKLDFRASGFIDAVSEYWVNTTPASVNNPTSIYNTIPVQFQPGPPMSTTTGFNANKKNAYMESRTRLKFDAVMGRDLSGTIFFEMDSSRWGDLAGGNSARVSERNSYGVISGDRAAVEIKNIYIDAALPYLGIPVPMQVRVGLQPLSMRNALFLYTDAMGVKASSKIDPVNIEGYWFKGLEGKDYSADDVDIWGLHANGRFSSFTLGGYFMYYNMNTYPLAQFTMTAGASSPFQADMGWYGVYADGKVGPLNINFDFIYDYGKVKPRSSSSAADDPDVKYSGWVGYLKVDYPYDMFNFGTVLMYSSGSDANDTSGSGLPGSHTANGQDSHKVTSFVIPPASESGAIYGESLVVYSSWVNRGNTGIGNTIQYSQLGRGGTGGTWMAKAYGSYKATPWYKVTLAGLYIGDTTKHGDTFGTARKAGGETLKNNSSIGWEFDLYNEFQIYKSLKFTVAGGYLFAGNAMEFWDSSQERNRELNNPWMITTNLTFTF